MQIPLKTFTGEFPRTNAYLIADNAAQQAVDCDFLAGSLRGISSRDPVAGVSGSNIKSLFVYEGGATSGYTYWWNRDVDAVRSPVVNDQYSRFYWADGSGFYVSNGTVGGNAEPSPTNRYKVGVPRPSTALSTAASKFTINGYYPVSFSVFCERTDGTKYNDTALGMILNGVASGVTVENNALDLFRAGATYALACDAAGSTPAASTTTTVTGDWKPNGYVRIGSESGPDVQVYGDSVFGYQSTKKVLFYQDPLSSSQINLYQDGVESGWQVVGTFSKLGDTYWYGSDSTITPPTNEGPKSTTATTAATSGPACRVFFENPTGGVLEVILREDGNKSTIPTELAGMGGAIKVTGSDWDISFWVKQDFIEHRAYTYTYVNQYGEEGAPADPFEVDCGTNASLTLRYTPPPSGYCPVSKIRVYRTATGGGTNYLYVGEAVVNSTTPTFADNVADSALGHTLDTMTYYPPDQSLVGQCVMANGIMVGFKGNEVHFSEPYLPYAWNPAAIKPFPHKVVGICPFEGGLYVTTTAEPYIIQGAAPEFMTDMKVAAVQAGVSQRSIANYNGQVVYASHDGLVMMQGAQASLDMSFKFFTRKDWQDRYGTKLSLIRLNVHDGSLVVWFTDGTPGFMIRFEEESPSLTQLSEPIYAAFVHPTADALYVSNGTKVYAYRAGAGRNNFTWWSKEFILPKPTNFGAMQFVGSGTVTLTVYADGVLKQTSVVTMTDTGRTIVRLVGGFLARRWSFKLVGSGEVQEVVLANTVSEIQNV